MISLVDMFEAGLMFHWVDNLPTIPRADKCFADPKSGVSRSVPIQLTDVASAFLILGIGTGLGILTFLIEQMYSNFKKRRRHGVPLINI